MQSGCEHFRNLIPRSLLGDLSTGEQEKLSLHLTACVACSHEKDLYIETLTNLHAAGDEPLPRHFFFYHQESKPAPWQVFRQMAFGWQASWAALLLFLGILSGISLANLRMQNIQGTRVLTFGKIPEPRASMPPSVSQDDLEKLQTRILQVVEENNRKEKLDWVRSVREEIAKSERSLTQSQRRFLETALAELETRMGNNLAATALALQSRNDSTINRMYQAVTQQRDRDMGAINSRLTRFAIDDEAKSTQTDSILDTLLQVAELRLK